MEVSPEKKARMHVTCFVVFGFLILFVLLFFFAFGLLLFLLVLVFIFSFALLTLELLLLLVLFLHLFNLGIELFLLLASFFSGLCCLCLFGFGEAERSIYKMSRANVKEVLYSLLPDGSCTAGI